jgi:hypothetical protein
VSVRPLLRDLPPQQAPRAQHPRQPGLSPTLCQTLQVFKRISGLRQPSGRPAPLRVRRIRIPQQHDPHSLPPYQSRVTGPPQNTASKHDGKVIPSGQAMSGGVRYVCKSLILSLSLSHSLHCIDRLLSDFNNRCPPKLGLRTPQSRAQSALDGFALVS